MVGVGARSVGETDWGRGIGARPRASPSDARGSVRADAIPSKLDVKASANISTGPMSSDGSCSVGCGGCAADWGGCAAVCGGCAADWGGCAAVCGGCAADWADGTDWTCEAGWTPTVPRTDSKASGRAAVGLFSRFHSVTAKAACIGEENPPGGIIPALKKLGLGDGAISLAMAPAAWTGSTASSGAVCWGDTSAIGGSRGRLWF